MRVITWEVRQQHSGKSLEISRTAYIGKREKSMEPETSIGKRAGDGRHQALLSGSNLRTLASAQNSSRSSRTITVHPTVLQYPQWRPRQRPRPIPAISLSTKPRACHCASQSRLRAVIHVHYADSASVTTVLLQETRKTRRAPRPSPAPPRRPMRSPLARHSQLCNSTQILD